MTMTLSMVVADQLLALLAARGVTVWADGTELALRVPAGALSPEELAAVREHKAAMVALLAAQDTPGEGMAPTMPTDTTASESSTPTAADAASTRIAAALALQAAHAGGNDAQIAAAWQAYLRATDAYLLATAALRRQDPAAARVMDAQHAARMCVALE